jgi:hypothetical protein
MRDADEGSTDEGQAVVVGSGLLSLLSPIRFNVASMLDHSSSSVAPRDALHIFSAANASLRAWT